MIYIIVKNILISFEGVTGNIKCMCAYRKLVTIILSTSVCVRSFPWNSRSSPNKIIHHSQISSIIHYWSLKGHIYPGK